MSNAKRINQKPNAPIQFYGHVKRVISFLDELYEFGPTRYYRQITGNEDVYDQFGIRMSDLSVLQINTGMARIRSLENRNRITPKAADFELACRAPEDQWRWLSVTKKYQRTEEDQ